jgi:FkbM family methyltransferase
MYKYKNLNYYMLKMINYDLSRKVVKEMIKNVRYRFSKATYKKIMTYRSLLREEVCQKGELFNHLNDYIKPFYYSLFFGRFYKYLTLYGLKIIKKQNKFIHSCSYKLNLKNIYQSKFRSYFEVLRELNQSLDFNEFVINNLKFVLNNDLDFQSTLFLELKDLIIPYLCNNHLLYNKSMLGEGTYESEDVFVENGDVVFDVGANMGIFSIFSIKMRKVKKVYAFEPINSTMKILESNCRINDATNEIVIVNKGLSNFEGKIDMSISSNMAANSMVFTMSENPSESVDVTTLDSFIDSNLIKKVDFIKVDIEGAERYFLEGARGTLAKFKPKLAICTYHLIDDPVILTKLILEANPSYKISYYSKKLFAI